MSTRVRRLAPWTQVAVPHQDILSGALDMATYAADLGAAHRSDPAAPLVYRDARAFFEQTYLTSELRRLLADALGVLAGEPGDQVLQLRTPFGGGKTHTLLALLHLVRSRDELRGLPELADLPDPGATRVAVLSGIDLDPLSPRTHDGLVARALWGELALQLGGPEAYAHVRAQDEALVSPGRDSLLPALGEGPVLVLMDEVMVYVTKSRGVEVGDGTLHQQVMAFLQTLTETVRSRPRTALVYSLQMSVAEAGGDEEGLFQLEKLVGRVDAVRTPVQGDEVMRVVQRRLFQSLGDPEARAQAAAEYARLHQEVAEGYATTDEDRRQAASAAQALEHRISESYPFHPALLDCMYHRWGSLPSYQRTRGALQFLACVVAALVRQPERALPLIGPGDVPLDDERTRGAFFAQVGTRQFDGPVEADIIGTQARAKEADRRVGQDAPDLERLRVGTRVATAALLYSFGARQGAERGVLEAELLGAVTAPGLDLGVLQRTLAELRTELLYLHSTGRLYRFEVTPNLNKLIADGAQALPSSQVLERLRRDLESALGAGQGGILWPPDPERVPDREPFFRIVYLDQDWNGLGDGAARTRLAEWLEHRGGNVVRQYRNALGFALMDPGAFNRATHAIRVLLTLEDMAERARTLQLSDEQRAEVRERTGAARAELKRTLDVLYDRVALPVGDPSGAASYAWVIERTEGRLLTGPTIHARLLDLLRGRVFDSLTPAKVAALLNLGDGEGQRRFYPCSQLVNDVFSFLQFPKLVGVEPIRGAVARGVAEGIFGYVPLAREADGSLVAEWPDLARIGVQVAASEIDLGEGAFLLSPGLAAELRPRGPGAPPLPVPESASPVAPPPTVRPQEAPRGIRISVSVEPRQLFRLMAGLQNLFDHSAPGARVDLTITARAAGDHGYDRSFLGNQVAEHFEEAGVEWRPELLE